MRNFVIVLAALTLFMACEAPMDQQEDQSLSYRGVEVTRAPAPFLVQNGLAKEGKDAVIISESSADATVYGSQDEETVYLAEGGEALQGGTWVGSLSEDPIEVSVGSGVTLQFEVLTEVTLLAAENIIYIDADEESIVFSGYGVILTSAISTGDEGSATLITTAQFSIGDEGAELQ